jgi:hypothetical protein
MSIKALLTTAATAQESALNTTKLRGGHYNFANTTARNTAYTTAGGAVAGDFCTVAGQPMWYDGSAWRNSYTLQTYGGCTRSTTLTVTMGAAAVLFDWDGTFGTQKNVTYATSTGLTIVTAGRYMINGLIQFNSAVTGTVLGYQIIPWKNGATINYPPLVARNTSGNSTVLSVTHALNLAVADTISLSGRVFGTGSGSAVQSLAILTIDRIGD